MEKELIVNNINELYAKQIDLINFIRSKEQEIYELKKEENNINTKRKYIEKRLEDFKEILKDILNENGIDNIKTEIGSISVRKNPISVEIIDENLIPKEYKKEITTIKIDKKAIAENFKNTGELIDGVKINTENTSLNIK